MKLCVVQCDIVWEDKQANQSRCLEAMKQAAEQGAQLVVFPEMSLTGFTMNTTLAEPQDGETAEFFMQASRELGIAVGFGFTCEHDGVITNRYCISDKGIITAEYDKLHPFSYGGESEVYARGNKPVTVNICGLTVGLTICYDLRFPELYQELSKTCDLILVAANWPQTRSEHWHTLLKARAIENQCYIAGCNRCGVDDKNRYSGGSLIYSPEGYVIDRDFGAYSERLLYAVVCRDECIRVREQFPLKSDRRRDLYKDFYAE